MSWARWVSVGRSGKGRPKQWRTWKNDCSTSKLGLCTPLCVFQNVKIERYEKNKYKIKISSQSTNSKILHTHKHAHMNKASITHSNRHTNAHTNTRTGLELKCLRRGGLCGLRR